MGLSIKFGLEVAWGKTVGELNLRGWGKIMRKNTGVDVRMDVLLSLPGSEKPEEEIEEMRFRKGENKLDNPKRHRGNR